MRTPTMSATDTLRARLQPYLPRLTLEWLAEDRGVRHHAVDGSLVFADISGFTKLSEKLAKLGTVGAEEMADAITTCFTDLLSVAYEQDGSLLKFGGDALLLLFAGDDPTEHAARAARAAIGMRKRLQTVGKLNTPGGRVNLRMSVGAHSGRFDFFLVGESHRELIVTGPGSSRVVEMEGTASAGEIVISPEFAANLPAGRIGAPAGEGHFLRSAPVGDPASPVWVLPELADETLEGSIPVAIRETLLAAIGEPEHRQVSVAFIHFDGTDALLRSKDPAAVADDLHELVSITQAAVDEYGVCFLGSDVDVDGGKLILTAGAPRAVGDDEQRMLLTLRRILDDDPPIRVRIGVNKGPVFAGDIGPRFRRTYTVMGDAVNLAARVMAKAEPGQLLATSSVLDASEVGFETVPLEPFMVKGKARPVTAFEVLGVAGVKVVDDEHDLPLVGRDEELAALDAAMATAEAGHGRLLEIVGPPGIGKTRLLFELRQRAVEFETISSACELYQATTPYAPVRTLLGAALRIPPDLDDADVAQLVRVKVEQVAPHLLPWLPLIALALDVEVPPTPEVDALGDEFRRGKLESAVSQLLALSLAGRPVLLEIEDVHWMDGASAALLTRLCEDIENGPWLIAVTRRDEDTGFVAEPGEGIVSLHPGPLPESAGESLLIAATEDSPFRQHELAVLVDRSGGNPLFLKELLSAARAAGGVDELPTSVDAIVTAQIDRLPLADRRLLRYAAVLGTRFTDELVEALLEGEDQGFDRAAWRRLDEFLEAEGPGVHRFRHALMRDAAYEGLPFRRRRQLHARVGDTICRRAGDDEDEVAELLSMHYFFAQQYEDAWKFSVIAGQRARAKFANVEAAAFLERAVTVAKRLTDVAPDELGDALLALGEVYELLGRYDDAKSSYQRARRAAQDEPVREARLLLRESWIPERTGNYSLCIRIVNRALKALAGVEGEEAAKLRAGLLGVYASHRHYQGRDREAIEWGNRAVAACELAGNREGLAQAYVSLSLAYADTGNLAESVRYSESALALLEEAGDLQAQAQILNNMGTYAYFAGHWDEAVERWQLSRELRLRTGDDVEAANGTNNVAEVLSDQGHLEEAERLFREALRVWKAAGFDQGVAFVQANLGRVAYRDGRPEEGLPMLRAAQRTFFDAGYVAQVLETDTRIAECLLFAGESTDALSVADNALEVESTREGLGYQRAALLRARAGALAQLGRIEEARAALEESLRSAREREADHEVAFTLCAMADLAAAEGVAYDEALEQERVALLERLGIVAVQAMPLSAA